MTPAQRQAAEWLVEAVQANIADLVERWKVCQEHDERETIHAEITATIKLEDSINARIEKHAAG